MKYLRVEKWESFKHYDRRAAVPWVKLPLALFEDDNFKSLDVASRLCFLGVLALAGEADGVSLNDPAYIGGRLAAEAPLDRLIAGGFLVEQESPHAGPTAAFERFWTAYPRKVSKVKA